MITGPLADVLAQFFNEAIADDITRRINKAAHDVHTEWSTRPNRDAYVDQAIREAAYRAVRDVLGQDYVTVHEVRSKPAKDPTSEPDPRRWGRVIRGQHTGERVYWDASLHARHENAWTNVERTHRFSADMVIGDA